MILRKFNPFPIMIDLLVQVAHTAYLFPVCFLSRIKIDCMTNATGVHTDRIWYSGLEVLVQTPTLEVMAGVNRAGVFEAE